MRLQTVVLIDADNTLWDTDAVFREAQLLLLRRLEHAIGQTVSTVDRLAFVRSYDQALAQAHHLHLRYPPRLLVRSLEAGLSGLSQTAAGELAIAGRKTPDDALATSVVDAIVAEYMTALGAMPELLPGVAEGIAAARKAGFRLYVLTEGRIDKQKRLLEAHKLQDSFDAVWELTKDRAQFARMLLRFPNHHVVVIGDQVDRDIIPARQAGCTTVLIPGRFTPSWNREGRTESADYVATDLLAAIGWCVESFCTTHADSLNSSEARSETATRT